MRRSSVAYVIGLSTVLAILVCSSAWFLLTEKKQFGGIGLVPSLGRESGRTDLLPDSAGQNSMAGNISSEQASSEPPEPDLIDPTGRIAMIDSWVRGGEASISFLNEIWSDRSASVDKRLMAAEALVSIGTSEALKIFLDVLMAEQDPMLRSTFSEALNAFSNLAVLGDLTRRIGEIGDPVILGALSDTISRMAQEETIDQLAEMHRLQSNVNRRDARVSTVLSGVRNPAAVPALVRLLESGESDDSALVSAAARSLSKIGSKDSLWGLGRVAGRGDQQSKAALEELALVSSPEALPILMEIASLSESVDVVDAVMIAMDRMAEEGKRILY